MSPLRTWAPLLLALTGVGVAAAWIFSLRLSGGDIFPAYSSLRADALGTRALFEAFERMEGFVARREYRPLPQLSRQPGAIFIAGLDWEAWRDVPEGDLAALELAARSGSRVVLAFRADRVRDDQPAQEDEEKEPKKSRDELARKKDREKKERERTERRREDQPLGLTKSLEKEWEVTFERKWLFSEENTADLEPGSAARLPPAVAWFSDLHFAVPESTPWRVVYRRGGRPVLIERVFGPGSIVLMADGYALSNEALHKHRATDLVAWLVASHRRVTFVESTLGVLRENGVGFLARRYGLGGALALAVLLGALYAWRRVVAFLPPQEEATVAGEVPLGYEPAAGFASLLRRALKPSDLLPACIDAWRKSRRGAGGAPDARLDAAWQARDAAATSTETYNSLASTLRPR